MAHVQDRVRSGPLIDAISTLGARTICCLRLIYGRGFRLAATDSQYVRFFASVGGQHARNAVANKNRVKVRIGADAITVMSFGRPELPERLFNALLLFLSHAIAGNSESNFYVGPDFSGDLRRAGKSAEDDFADFETGLHDGGFENGCQFVVVSATRTDAGNATRSGDDHFEMAVS